MNITTIINHLPKGVHRAGLVVQKFSPEILTGLGIASGIGCVITACRATLKVNDILDEHAEVKDDIDHAETHAVDYTHEDAKKDRVVLTAKTAGMLIRNYAPAVGFGVTSIACILGGHGILSKRNAALSCAYSLIQDQFNQYRDRVREDLGNDRDMLYLHGMKEEEVEVEEVNPNTGRKKKVKKTTVCPIPDFSQYAKCFDEASPHWHPSAEMNRLHIMNMQNYANDLLHCRGHVFLNEIYDGLGIPRTSAGAVVGWVDSDDGVDHCIDFGLWSPYNADFMNGYENNVWLDFNVDGVIYDLI